MVEQDFRYIDEEDDEISIGAIIALGFRHLKFVLLCAVICAVAVFGLLFAKSRTSDAIEDFLKESQEYETTINTLEATINSLKKQYDAQVKYDSNSLFMTLNADDYYTAKANFAVFCEEPIKVNEKGNSSFQASNIVSQYIETWNSMDVSSVLKKDLAAEYIRLVLGFNGESEPKSSENNTTMIVISAMANTEAEARSMVDCICDYYIALSPSISTSYAKHELRQISEISVAKSSSQKIAEEQNKNISRESTLYNNILKSEKDYKELLNDKPVLFHPLKYTVIGFAAGFFLACVYLLIRFLSNSPVYSSSYITEQFDLPYFGSINKKERLALHEKMLNERLWNANDAKVYISENVKNRIASGSKVLVLSSGSIEGDNVKTVADILTEQKMVPFFVELALTNSETVGKVKDCDCMLLLERTWKTKSDDIKQLVSLSKQFEKPVVGFVTVLD